MSVFYEVTRCDECPNHETERTPRSGFALDYFCKLTNEKVNGYVEYESDWKGFKIPDSCPLERKKEDEDSIL